MTEAMYQMVQLRLTGELGTKIESLASQLSDVQFVAQALETIEAASEEATTLFAYWSSALVAYGRLLMSGRRERLDASFVTESEHAAAHREWLDLRNRHVAHRVSDAEQVRAIGFLTALQLEPKSVEGVGQFAAKMIGRGPEDLVRDKALVDHVQRHLANLMEKATQEALRELQTRPIGDLYRTALRGEPYPLSMGNRLP